MKLRLRTVGTTFFATLAAQSLCSTSWASPPGPPVIPATPVGNVAVTAATIAAVAGYGFWKSRR